MYINALTVLTNLDGKVLRLSDAEESEALTLGFVIVEALLHETPEDKLSGNEKLALFELAQKFHKPANTHVRIDNAEAEKIKKLVARRYKVLIAGQVIQLINEAPTALPSFTIAGAAE